MKLANISVYCFPCAAEMTGAGHRHAKNVYKPMDKFAAQGWKNREKCGIIRGIESNGNPSVLFRKGNEP